MIYRSEPEKDFSDEQPQSLLVDPRNLDIDVKCMWDSSSRLACADSCSALNEHTLPYAVSHRNRHTNIHTRPHCDINSPSA